MSSYCCSQKILSDFGMMPDTVFLESSLDNDYMWLMSAKTSTHPIDWGAFNCLVCIFLFGL